MSLIVKYPEALAWKHPDKGGITTKAGQLTGFPEDLPYPTQQDIDSWEAEWKDAMDAIAYKDKRKVEYPDIGDQLDAIWMQLNKDRLEGKNFIQDADDMLGEILGVKAKHPKPEK